MKKRTRVLSVLLAATMAFSAVGCGAKNNPYSNMGNVDDKTKVQKAKNISQAQELNQKMEAQLLKGKAGQRKLDELVAALPS